MTGQPEEELHRLESLCTRIDTPTAGGGTTAWRVWGTGAPLLLLHGGSGSWTHWVRNVEPLANAGWCVIVPDLPGFGDSALPTGVRDVDGIVEPLAAGLREVLGALREQGVHLAGFSFGGMTGGLLAAAHPDLVRHLVIIGAPALGLGTKRPTLYDWRHLPDAVAQREVHRRNLGILMLHDNAAIDDFAISIQAGNVSRDRMRRRRLATTDLLARTLPQVQCRVDAIYASEDIFYVHLKPQLRELLASLPTFGELVFIEDAGHWVQYERPAEFNAELLRLLAR